MRTRFLLFAVSLAAAVQRSRGDTANTQPAARPAPAAAAAFTTVAPGSRILKTFNFEERALGNFESTPMFWSKVVGRGFPAYASGRLDSAVFRIGTKEGQPPGNSFRLDIDSGSAAYRFVAPPGQRIPIDANADYYVLGFVKTTPLQNARAQISAWFADEKGTLLPTTETHSERYASPPSEGGAAGDSPDPPSWHVMHLFIPGPKSGDPAGAEARSLVLQLGLLQPQQLAASGTGGESDSPLGQFQLYQQDIRGTAWFDDITVFQLPRVGVEVPASVTANIFSPNQQVDLDLMVSDLAHKNANGGLGVSLKIADPDGLIFAAQKWSVTTAPDRPWKLRYSHAPLPPGLYTATLDVSDGETGSLIARRQTRFACLTALAEAAGTDKPGEKGAHEFGFSAVNWPLAAWNELPTVFRQTGVGLAQIPAWHSDMSEDDLRQRDPAFDGLLTSLERMNVHTLASLAELPEPLAAKLHPEKAAGEGTQAAALRTSLQSLADSDPAIWRPYASFLLARYSNQVDEWELGSPESPFSGSLDGESPRGGATGNEQYPKLYARTMSELGTLLNRPQLVIPWNALFDFNEKLYPHAMLDLCIPSAVKPSQIPSYVKGFREAESGGQWPANGSPAPEILLHIDPLEAGPYARTDRVADFAQRVVFARSTTPTAVLMNLPLSRPVAITASTAHTEPDELLIAYRTLVYALGGASFRCEMPILPGIRGFLFKRGPSGTLVLWNEGAEEPEVLLKLPLGASPRLMNLNGLSRPLTVDPQTLLSNVAVTSMPVIVTDVDANLLELRASFSFATANFPAGAGIQRTQVLLANPYPDVLAATLHMAPPAGWTIDPPSFPVSIGPGKTFRQPVTIRYPFTEAAGPKNMAARLTSDGEGPGSRGRPLELSFPVAVSSNWVETDAFARVLPNGDLAVQQMITNISTVPVNAEAYALVPGYARQQRFVLDLQPGQTTIKRFVFPMSSYVNYTDKVTPADISAALAGKTASVGLRQNDGKTLITKTFALP